jgi:N-acylneuraminate cytidylyltransferase
MNILAIIPARSGSKGVVNKNIRQLSGHPLIAYSIKAALKSESISRVILSTDSEEYAEIGRKYGADVPFIRPSVFAGDKSGDIDVVNHTLSWLMENEKKIPDAVAYLRPSTPLRSPKVIQDCIKIFASKFNDITSLRSMHEMSESAYKTCEIADGYIKHVGGSSDADAGNLPRQNFPKTYQPNGYIDIVKTDYILNEKKLFGNRSLAFITEYTSEVDTIEDFEFIEYQIQKKEEIYKELFK